MSSMSLESCPSCGESGKIEQYEEWFSFGVWNKRWRVRCVYCRFKCDGFKIRNNAIKRWNTRVKRHEKSTTNTTT